MGTIRSSDAGSFISTVKDAARHKRVFLMNFPKREWVLAKLAKIEGLSITFHVLSSNPVQINLAYLAPYEFDYSIFNEEYGVTFGGNVVVHFSTSTEGTNSSIELVIDECFSSAFMDALSRKPTTMSQELSFFKGKIVDISVEKVALYLDNARPGLDLLFRKGLK